MVIRAGFIGLGNIGKPMARRIVDAGLPLTVFDVAPAPLAELSAAGARAAASAAEVAAASDVVGVCVRDDAEVRAVVVGDDGISAGAAPGLVVAIHSTVLPRTVRDLAERLQRRGIDVVDACVTGGAAGAAQGKLTYMVGGEAPLVEKCRPVFATSAQRIVHTGPLGSGVSVKLCNNLMTYLGFLAAFEATSLARAGGLSEQALEEVTRANGNLTDQMLAFLALHRLPAETREDPSFLAMLESFKSLAEKDLAVTLEFARESGVELPGAERCRELMGRVYGLED